MFVSLLQKLGIGSTRNDAEYGIQNRIHSLFQVSVMVGGWEEGGGGEGGRKGGGRDITVTIASISSLQTPACTEEIQSE